METYKNQPATIGGFLNGSFLPVSGLPQTIKDLILTSGKVVIVRETTTNTSTTSKGSSGGGRTSGTMWYKGNVLGFTVEDAIKETKKVQDKTAIPDLIPDASKFNGIPSTYYNIIQSPSGKKFIQQTHVNGKGLRVSSAKDPSGQYIYESDVFLTQNFETSPDNPVGVAFSGVFIHHGSDEGASSGCIIFSKTRNANKTVVQNAQDVIDLHRYFINQNIVGKGKLQQLVVLNLWEFPTPPPIVESTGTIINQSTNEPIKGATVKIQEPLPPAPTLGPQIIPQK